MPIPPSPSPFAQPTPPPDPLKALQNQPSITFDQAQPGVPTSPWAVHKTETPHTPTPSVPTPAVPLPARPIIPQFQRTVLPDWNINHLTPAQRQEGQWSASAAGTIAMLAGVIALSIWMRQRKPKPKHATLSVEAVIAKMPIVVPNHPLIAPPVSVYSEETSPATPPTPIELCRQLLGPVPRPFEKSLQPYLAVDRPIWMPPAGDDSLDKLLDAQERLRYQGKVGWAAIVQANIMLFDRGPVDLPASILWSDDPAFDLDPNALITIAMDVYALKGTDQADPDANTLARILSGAGTGRVMNYKIPKRFTEGRNVYLSASLIPRKHLPDGLLTRHLMPVWLDPEPTGFALMVPAAYWPASLLTWWRSPDPQPPESKPADTANDE